MCEKPSGCFAIADLMEKASSPLPGIGLVHTRLSLLDLNERSNQPFWDKSKRFALVYNGDIYNFAELREQLIEQGVEFRTTSDTEVLLECLLKWGPGLAAKTGKNVRVRFL